MKRLLLSIAIYSLCVHAFASQGIAGVWGREEWNCGGRSCTPQDVRLGTAQRIFEGLRIETSGTKVCGIWYSHAAKVYRGFLVGNATQEGFFLSFGQEIDHDPSFFAATSFSQLPNFKTERTEMVTLVAGELTQAPVPLAGGSPSARTFHRLPRAERVRWGLGRLAQWEKEYLAACRREA